jgi:hypothetical protein
MKFCPNCQTPYDDLSLKFCLQCGTPLPEAAQTRKTGGNAIIAAAILGGFLLLMLIVGGMGVYLFSRPGSKPPIDLANSQIKQSNGNGRIQTPNDQRPSVEQLDNKALFPANSANVAGSANSSNNVSTAKPRIVASSSSVRKPDGGNFYFPNLAFDSNPATAWCEGVKGAGIGEWLQFSFDREVTLKQIKIAPGYFKNDEAWRKNNRVAQISIGFSDDSTKEFSLTDERKMQTLEVGRIRTDWVKIMIKNYFAGESDSDDTLISEVSFVTEP